MSSRSYSFKRRYVPATRQQPSHTLRRGRDYGNGCLSTYIVCTLCTRWTPPGQLTSTRQIPTASASGDGRLSRLRVGPWCQMWRTKEHFAAPDQPTEACAMTYFHYCDIFCTFVLTPRPHPPSISPPSTLRQVQQQWELSYWLSRYHFYQRSSPTTAGAAILWCRHEWWVLFDYHIFITPCSHQKKSSKIRVRKNKKNKFGS